MPHRNRSTSVQWSIDDHDRNVRRAYDLVSGQHVATTNKVDGHYTMFVIDKERRDQIPVFVGTRSSLQDAQWLLSTIAELHRVLSVEKMRRGNMTKMEMLALIVDLVERKILEQVAGDE